MAAPKQSDRSVNGHAHDRRRPHDRDSDHDSDRRRDRHQARPRDSDRSDRYRRGNDRSRSRSRTRRRSRSRSLRRSRSPTNRRSARSPRRRRRSPTASRSPSRSPEAHISKRHPLNPTTRSSRGQAERRSKLSSARDPERMDVDTTHPDDEDACMRSTMGFAAFKTTKQTKVPGNDIYGVRKEKKTEYRQYMNRPGGFNRPLSPTHE